MTKFKSVAAALKPLIKKWGEETEEMSAYEFCEWVRTTSGLPLLEESDCK